MKDNFQTETIVSKLLYSALSAEQKADIMEWRNVLGKAKTCIDEKLYLNETILHHK